MKWRLWFSSNSSLGISLPQFSWRCLPQELGECSTIWQPTLGAGRHNSYTAVDTYIQWFGSHSNACMVTWLSHDMTRPLHPTGCGELWPHFEPCAEPRGPSHRGQSAYHPGWPGHWSVSFVHHLPLHQRPLGEEALSHLCISSVCVHVCVCFSFLRYHLLCVTLPAF